MSLHDLANVIYLATRDDPAAVAAIQSEKSTLALAIATDPNASRVVTSATVNGQSFAMSGGITQGMRLVLLDRVCRLYTAGKTVSNISIPALP